MILAIIIDLVLIGIIGFGIYYGVTKGFVFMAAKPFKTVFAIIFAYTSATWFAELIVSPVIGAPIKGYVSDFLYTNLPNITPTTAPDELPTLLKMAAAAFGVDFASAAVDGTSYIDTLVATLSDPVIGVISIIFSAIALFFIGKLIFSLALFLLNKFCNAGLLGKINKILGIVFGAFVFVLISWGVAVLISVIFHLPVFDSNELISGFEGGLIYKFFNFMNPIVLLLSF